MWFCYSRFTKAKSKQFFVSVEVSVDFLKPMLACAERLYCSATGTWNEISHCCRL